MGLSRLRSDKKMSMCTVSLLLLIFVLPLARTLDVQKDGLAKTNDNASESTTLNSKILRRLFQGAKYPIICSFLKPPEESEMFEIVGTMDMIDVTDDEIYVMIHSFGDHIRQKIQFPSLTLEEEMSAKLHKKPPPYNSRYFERYPFTNYTTITGFSCYRNLEGSYETMEVLANQYTNLVEVIDIGPSHLKSIGEGGYEMKALKLTNRDSTAAKAPLFIICGLHARELAPTEICARFAEDMLESYGTDADKTWILDQTEIHIIMQANPDGRKYEETFMNWKRKNMNFNKPFYCLPCNSDTKKGVDLNRNFPHSEWGTIGVGRLCQDTYPGTSPGSEKETEAVTNYVLSVLPPGSNAVDETTGAYVAESKGTFIDIHSYMQAILWPWAFANEVDAPNKEGLTALAKKMAAKTSPQYASNNDIYPTAGDTTDWAYEAIGVAAYTIEVGYEFHEPCDVFENTVLANGMNTLLYAARVANAPYKYPKGPEVISLSLPSNITLSETLSVEVVVSDSLGTIFYDTVLQNVAAIRLYIDSHPYDDDAAPVAELSQNFGATASETFEVSLSGYGVGRHTIFIQAEDDDGLGPVYSQFFETIN